MDPRRLGQILVAEGLIGDDELDQALKDSRAGGTTLLESVVKLKLLDEETIANFLGHQFGLEVTTIPADFKPNPQARALIPPELARRYRLVPLAVDRTTLTIAVENPGDVEAAEQRDIRQKSRIPPEAVLKLVVAPLSQVTAALAAMYPAGAAGSRGHNGPGSGGEITTMDAEQYALRHAPARQEVTHEDVTETLDPEALLAQASESVEVTSAEGAGEEYSIDVANEEPVMRMCNYLIAEACRRRASDIHINPTARGITVRYRIDGVLQIMPSPPPSMKKGVIARFKVMANMNITERRKPQDGRIKIKVYDRTIDLRVSVIPQMDGENIVMRILDQSSLQLDLKKLGFEPQEMEVYDTAIRSPYGMILHTGPTGSGKTTTLYSALSYIYDPKRSFCTLEDPVEYEMPGVVQIQMDHEVGLDFAIALRSALRQDPNVMMVGEIRDGETAGIAVSAALTGHLLFSTLHTNDAPSTIGRLVDMGVEPAYVGTAVRLIVAQRLMRRTCAECKQATTPTEEELKVTGVSEAEAAGGTFFKSIGCPKCSMTGYKGRIGIYEMMRNTPELSEAIFAGADSLGIRAIAESQGMRSLRGLAIQKWKDGITTTEEVQRVTMGGD
ncbi:MAG: ATPase, T2SS/T4P/T4SS family [Candidatus Coatesbacteria bacterium]